MDKIDILRILDEMDDFRRKHHQHPADWCMRCMEAILAGAAGYEDRNEWTEELKADPGSAYAKYLGGN